MIDSDALTITNCVAEAANDVEAKQDMQLIHKSRNKNNDNKDYFNNDNNNNTK